MTPTPACAPDDTPVWSAPLRVVAFVAGVATLLAACSSSSGSANSGQSVAQVKAAVLSAWRAAENAIYRAGASRNGASSPILAATMVDPELTLVRTNLTNARTQGLIGRGTWNLGSPKVTSIQPSASDPRSATVQSCIDDSAILVSQSTGQPASGISGTAGWIGATSKMVFEGGRSWKLAHQSAVFNPDRSLACAGI